MSKDSTVQFTEDERKAMMHVEICKKLSKLYIDKNSDYGDAYGKLRDEHSNALLIEIYKKYCRLKTLMQGAEQRVKGETIEDSLKDIANYCIMELIEREVELK